MQSVMVRDDFFSPCSVALIGASEEAGRIGSGLYKCLSDSGIEVFCVNPAHDAMWGGPCYHTVKELPEHVSHAFIAVSRRYVPGCLRECIEFGIRNVVVISAGFKEVDQEGARMEREMAQLCREHGVRLLGPNTLGLVNTGCGFNGTFLPAAYKKGGVSIISQSGGVGMALLSALADQHCGVAKWIGIGNEAVLDAVEFLRYLAGDDETKAIAVCFEGLKNFPDFIRLASEVNQIKPIVLLRDGKSGVGMKAAVSHTGAMVHPGAVMRGIFRQFGLAEAESCRDCAVMLKALNLAPAAAGNRCAVLTNTAGPSILASDRMEPAGVALPQPTAALRDGIDRQVGLKMGLKNPADISSNGLTPRNYGIAAETLLGSDEYDMLLSFFTLNEHLMLPEQELIDAAQKTKKPAVACYLSSAEDFGRYGRRPESFGIPCYYDPQDAATACAAIAARAAGARHREAAPAAVSEEGLTAVSRYLDSFCPGERQVLSEEQSKELLRLAGAGVTVPVVADGPEAAVLAAGQLGYPVALKLDSRRISHKSDVGGVRLNIKTEDELFAAAAEMLQRLRPLDPDARLSVQPMLPEGFELIAGAAEMLQRLRPLDPDARLSVQPMLPEGFELIAGAVRTELGGLLMTGMGGVYSELLKDNSFRLLPLKQGDAERMLEELRCADVFRGFRGTALDRSGVCGLLGIVAELVGRFPRISEIELNPCRCYEDSVAILDARVVLD